MGGFYDSKLKILFIGLGSIGQRHLRLLKELYNNQVEIVAYRSGKSKNSFEDVREFQDFEKTLATEPDVAFITNPTHLHVKFATICADHGCNLFIEKPLSHNMEGVEQLIDVVSRKDLITLMGCNLRFHPVLQKVNKLLGKNILGDIYIFRAYAGSYLPEWRPGRDYRKVYSAKKEMGGGAILDLIHEIDYSYWLFGPFRELKSLYGQIGHLEIETEDVAEIILKGEDGKIGNIHLDYVRRNPRRTLEIVGERGVINADLNEGLIEIKGPDLNKEFKFDFERDDMYRKQIEYFIEHIQENKHTFNDVETGAKTLKLALEAKEAI